MSTPAFDAVCDFPVREEGGNLRGIIRTGDVTAAASIEDYGFPGRRKAPFVRILPSAPVEARWRDEFEILAGDGRRIGRAVCLLPAAPLPEELKPARRKALLELLAGSEEDMLLALSGSRGLRGVRESELSAFCRLDPGRMEALARSLEADGRVRILAFSPLFLVSQDALDFLGGRITSFLVQFHKKHPGQRGATLERIERRFPAPRSVLHLAIRALERAGRVGAEGGFVRLADFRIPLSPADEAALGELEEMFLKGEFGAVTLDEIRDRFRLSPGKLQVLLTVLTERKKIVEGRDGYILHSQWLDELVAKLRASGKRELSVADFKALTGLTRKYAIPLLELLDEMGVTRRRGAHREIL